MSMSHGGEVSNIIYLDLPLPEVLPPLLLSAVDSKQVTVTSQMLPSVNQLVSAYRYHYLPKPNLNYHSLTELNFSVR